MQAFLLGIQSFCSKLNTCVHDGIDLVYSILCTIYCNTRPECQFFFLWRMHCIGLVMGLLHAFDAFAQM